MPFFVFYTDTQTKNAFLWQAFLTHAQEYD